MLQLLVVEDDVILRDGISDYLKTFDDSVFRAESAEEGLEIFESEDIDLIVLDLMLPKMSGLDMLQEIRKTSNVPVIILTAIGDEQTQCRLFDKLADDYLIKPFSLPVLKKHIDAQLRRAKPSRTLWHYGKAKVDFQSFEAFYEEVPTKLTTKEFRLLEYLVEHENIIMNRTQLLDYLTDGESAPYDRVIDVYIKNLRRKLRLDCIVTVKGMGYKLDSQVKGRPR